MDKLTISSVVSINEPAIEPQIDDKKPQPDNQSIDIPQLLNDRDEALAQSENLLKVIDRKNSEIERLESDLNILKQQLKASVEAKCAAITKFDEIQSKMTQIEFKERRFDQERSMMENRIETLTMDLDRNIQELQKFRKESTTQILTLEAKLHEKTEELGICGKQMGQMKEANASLNLQVEDLLQKLRTSNETFSSSLQKYQQELKAKTRLSELYKEKSEDVLTGQQDITSIVTELRAALKEATDEYGKLESTLKAKEAQHEQERDDLKKAVEELKNELESSRQEKIEKSIGKLFGPTATTKLSGRSMTEIFSLYIRSSQELEELQVENFVLKKEYAELVQEIQEKAPEIQIAQLEVEKLQNDNEILRFKLANYANVQKEIDALVNEVQSLQKSLAEVEEDRANLTQQVLSLIKGKSDDDDGFGNVEELYFNNLKLVAFVKELSTEIEKLKTADESLKTKHFTNVETQTPKVDQKVETELKSKLELLQSRKEKLDEQLELLRSQNSEFSITNLRLKAQAEQHEGQLKLQQKNVEILKQKLQNLEEKFQNATTTNSKLEIVLQNCNVELRNSEIDLRNLTRKHESLQRENQFLIKNEAKLKAECEVFQRQSQLQAHMMANLEFIKASIERSESENKSKIDEKILECDELRKQLEEEKERYKNLKALTDEIFEDKDEEIANLHEMLSKAYEDIEKLSEEQKREENLVNEVETFVTCADSNNLEMSVDESLIKSSNKRKLEDEEEVDENDEKRAKVDESEDLEVHGGIMKKLERRHKCRYHHW